jgi:coenzyme F420 hydrogenase subunit beta
LTDSIHSSSEKSHQQEIRKSFYEKAAQPDSLGSWFEAWYQISTHEPFEAVDFLMSDIVEKGRCVGCAACFYVCPVNVFDYADEKPIDSRHTACVSCGLCVAVCPPAHLGSSQLSNYVIKKEFKDEGFGRYRLATLARARNKTISGRGQDGGIATTILIQALDDGMVDAIILGDVVEGNPLAPIPRLARTREEVLHSSGSRYTYSPNTTAIREAYDQNLKVAVVGVPCQINGLRHVQNGAAELFSFNDWYKKNVIFTLGLFCSEVFTHKGLEYLSGAISVPLENIVNINVKGRIISKTKDGREIVSSLKDMRKYMRPSCNFCWDYSAELADISLGGIGLKGWTFTVTRTEVGQKLFDRLLEKDLIEVKSLKEELKSKELLIKLSAQKRNRSKHYEI